MSMPYKNKDDYNKYMRDYRKMEREILRRARDMGIQAKPLKPRKRR